MGETRCILKNLATLQFISGTLYCSTTLTSEVMLTAHSRCSVTVLFLTHKKAKVQNIYLLYTNSTTNKQKYGTLGVFFTWFVSKQFDQ